LANFFTRAIAALLLQYQWKRAEWRSPQKSESARIKSRAEAYPASSDRVEDAVSLGPSTSKGGNTSFAEKPELILLIITSFFSDLLKKTQDYKKSYCKYFDIEGIFWGDYEVCTSEPEVLKKNLRFSILCLQGCFLQ
jgi:hypothetical protein